MNLVYSDYGADVPASCESFIYNVVLANLLVTGLISLPMFWVFFWMIVIKGVGIILGLISPPALIWLKKKTA